MVFQEKGIPNLFYGPQIYPFVTWSLKARWCGGILLSSLSIKYKLIIYLNTYQTLEQFYLPVCVSLPHSFIWWQFLIFQMNTHHVQIVLMCTSWFIYFFSSYETVTMVSLWNVETDGMGFLSIHFVTIIPQLRTAVCSTCFSFFSYNEGSILAVYPQCPSFMYTSSHQKETRDMWIVEIVHSLSVLGQKMVPSILEQFWLFSGSQLGQHCLSDLLCHVVSSTGAQYMKHKVRRILFLQKNVLLEFQPSLPQSQGFVRSMLSFSLWRLQDLFSGVLEFDPFWVIYYSLQMLRFHHCSWNANSHENSFTYTKI